LYKLRDEERGQTCFNYYIIF